MRDVYTHTEEQAARWNAQHADPLDNPRADSYDAAAEGEYRQSLRPLDPAWHELCERLRREAGA